MLNEPGGRGAGVTIANHLTSLLSILKETSADVQDWPMQYAILW